MQRPGPAAYVLVTITLVFFIFHQIYNVKLEINQVRHSVVVLLKDLETKAVIADKHLEERVVAKAKASQGSRLEQSKLQLQHRVASDLEGTLVKKFEGMHELAGKNKKEQTQAVELDALSMLAQIKEYVSNYQSSDIPIEVRRWYTYVAKNVEYINSLKQDDPVLIKYIQTQVLIPPAPNDAPYVLKEPNNTDPSQGQTAAIRKIFKNKKDGYFIECGALDGEFFSNTITLERELGWTGVLIEADPINFKDMLPRNRKAWMVPACLSLKKTPQMVAFAKNTFSLGKIETEKNLNAKKSDSKHFDIHCMPLTAILTALNRTEVDYFSLDIEGNELDVLRTIDFAKIKIKVLAVEHSHGAEPKENMKKLMEDNGYHSVVSKETWTIENFIFIRKDSGLTADD